MVGLRVTRSEIGRVPSDARCGEDLMAQAAQNIALPPSRDIPIDKLVLSQSNVQRIKAGVTVEGLAEDIARRGLLQGLNVRPILDEAGVETGKFEIPAGGRRFQALSLLVKQKRLPKTAPIPCIVRDARSAILAEDDSLAENMQRVALHPLDQFRAFAALREKGQGDEEIAAAFFLTPQIVRQRLKLASVAPALLEIYSEDGMTLEQLMAFTLNSDHARQVQVWDAVKHSWNKEPYSIRGMLTETTVRASDRRAVFVGIEAYEAAGGTVMRDLFQGDDGGWLEDVDLLDRLVTEKLQAEAQALVAEGWKWIEVAVDLPYGFAHGLRRLAHELVPKSEADAAEHGRLLAEYRALEAEWSEQDEMPDEATCGSASWSLLWRCWNSDRSSSTLRKLGGQGPSLPSTGMALWSFIAVLSVPKTRRRSKPWSTSTVLRASRGRGGMPGFPVGMAMAKRATCVGRWSPSMASRRS